MTHPLLNFGNAAVRPVPRLYCMVRTFHLTRRRVFLPFHTASTESTRNPNTMSQLEDTQMEESQGDQSESQNVAQETPAEDVFIPPSINNDRVLSGESYTHLSAVPSTLTADMSTECVLGVDEAGRGPVLGTYSGTIHRPQCLFVQAPWCMRCTTYLYPCTGLCLPKHITSTTPRL